MKTRILLFTGFAIVVCAAPAYAAQVHIAPPAEHVGTGDSFIVRVSLDAQGGSINALEGAVTYPRNLLKIVEIRDGNSLLNFWIERPHDTGGSVRFAGVAPGGFAGESGDVFDLVFEAIDAGEVRLAFSDARALLNDGRGTSATLTTSAPVFSVGSTGSGAHVVSLIGNDYMPPETFMPEVNSDSSLFDGQAFVTFATQDKESGVDHYEVAERTGFQASSRRYDTLPWVSATSPHLLRDQARQSYLYVKAIDRAGNVRVAVLSPIHLPFYYNAPILLGILILWLLTCGAMFYAYRHKKTLLP